MKCPNCGNENEDGMRFCGECGTPLPQEKKCPNCGAMVPLKMKFCGECGCRMDGASANAGSTGGLSMGDKNVIAGDVIGKKEDYTIAGNATIVKNEDESRKILSCAVCGKHLLNSEAITCPKCGKTVCTEHFNRGANECSDCAKIKAGSKIDAYNAKLAEVYADGRVDFDERRELDELASSLGISSEQAGQLEARFKSNMDDENSLTRAEKYEIENAKKLLLDGNSQEAAKIMEPLYARFGETNVRVFSLYLRALKGCDAGKAKQIISSVKVDIPETYITQIDFALAEENLGDAERLINRAKKLFPDDVVVRCKEAEYLFLFAKKTGDENIMREFNELVESLPESADEYEQWCVSYVKEIQSKFDDPDFKLKTIVIENGSGGKAGSKVTAGAKKILLNGKDSYPTIQEAINAAKSGDEILIGSGVYEEELKINKNVTLIGEGSNEDEYPVIYFTPTPTGKDYWGYNYSNGTCILNISCACTLKNVCIQEYADEKDWHCNTGKNHKVGLVSINENANFENVLIKSLNMYSVLINADANPSFKNSQISSVCVLKNGSGFFENCKIFCGINCGIDLRSGSRKTNPIFKSCFIQDNSNDERKRWYNGICVANMSAGVFENCEIEGCCVRLSNKTNTTFKNCRIHGNSEGLGISTSEAAVGLFENCQIFDNHRKTDKGEDYQSLERRNIDISKDSKIEFKNCTIGEGSEQIQKNTKPEKKATTGKKTTTEKKAPAAPKIPEFPDQPNHQLSMLNGKVVYKGDSSKFTFVNVNAKIKNGNTINLTAGRINNSSPWDTASLNLYAWLSNGQYNGGTLNGKSIGSFVFEPLKKGYGFPNVNKDFKISKDIPDGTYYFVVTMNEYCSDGKNYIMSWINFTKPLILKNHVASWQG